MKKFFYSLGLVLSIGLISSQFNVYAAETEPNQNLQEDEIIMDPMDPTTDPTTILSPNEKEDGVNDSSNVNFQIRKISDEVLPQVVYLGDVMPLGAGSWDYLGSSSFQSTSKVFKSGGGNIKIHIYQPDVGPGSAWQYALMEQDPTVNDLVYQFGNVNEPGQYEIIYNVSNFVDGGDGAELFLKKLNYATKTVDTYWWD